MLNHLFRWSSFWSWRVCKQAKLSHLGHRKPAPHTLKSPRTQNESLSGADFGPEAQLGHFFSKMSKEIPLQSMAIVIGGYWQHLVSTGRSYVPHSRSYTRCFATCFWRSHYQPFVHLGAAIWHRWTIICGVPSKISVRPTSQRQLTLKRTIFVKPLVKYSWTQSIMCLKTASIV